MAEEPIKQLPIPDAVTADPTSMPVISAWVGKSGLHVAAQRAFDKPEGWGMMLLDLARHASRMYAQQGVMTEGEAMSRIAGVMSQKLGAGPAQDSGTTTFL